MKKILSIFLCIFCITLTITGICLIAAGLKKGGTLNFTIDFKKQRVSPISENMVSDSFALDAFESVDVDCTLGKVEIVEGDTFFVEYELYGDEVPSISVEDKTLKIKSKSGTEIFSGVGINNNRVYVNITGFFNIVGDKKGGIKITVPKDTKMKNVSVKTDCGIIKLEDVTCTDAILKNDVGNIIISNTALSKANITSDTGNVKLIGLEASQVKVEDDTGNLNVEDSTIEELKVSLNTGNAKLRNDLLKNVNIKCDTGNVTGAIKGNATEYNMELKTNTGNITINGEKVKKSYFVSDSAEKDIVITTDTGNVKLTFE